MNIVLLLPLIIVIGVIVFNNSSMSILSKNRIIVNTVLEIILVLLISCLTVFRYLIPSNTWMFILVGITLLCAFIIYKVSRDIYIDTLELIRPLLNGFILVLRVVVPFYIGLTIFRFEALPIQVLYSIGIAVIVFLLSILTEKGVKLLLGLIEDYSLQKYVVLFLIVFTLPIYILYNSISIPGKYLERIHFTNNYVDFKIENEKQVVHLDYKENIVDSYDGLNLFDVNHIIHDDDNIYILQVNDITNYPYIIGYNTNTKTRFLYEKFDKKLSTLDFPTTDDFNQAVADHYVFENRYDADNIEIVMIQDQLFYTSDIGIYFIEDNSLTLYSKTIYPQYGRVVLLDNEYQLLVFGDEIYLLDSKGDKTIIDYRREELAVVSNQLFLYSDGVFTLFENEDITFNLNEVDEWEVTKYDYVNRILYYTESKTEYENNRRKTEYSFYSLNGDSGEKLIDTNVDFRIDNGVLVYTPDKLNTIIYDEDTNQYHKYSIAENEGWLFNDLSTDTISNHITYKEISYSYIKEEKVMVLVKTLEVVDGDDITSIELIELEQLEPELDVVIYAVMSKSHFSWTVLGMLLPMKFYRVGTRKKENEYY